MICPIHDVEMRHFEKNGQTWDSHILGDKTWCNGKPKKTDYAETWDRRKSDFVESLGTPESPAKAEVDWDAKERRMVRMNVLNRATDLVVADKVDIKQIESVAEKLEEWIYRE